MSKPVLCPTCGYWGTPIPKRLFHPLPLVINPGGSFDLSVKFVATSGGFQAANLTINTNDGDDWNDRLSFNPFGAMMGYPTLFRNFSDEIIPTMIDYGGGSLA